MGGANGLTAGGIERRAPDAQFELPNHTDCALEPGTRPCAEPIDVRDPFVARLYSCKQCGEIR